MSQKNLKILAGIIGVLIAIYVAINFGTGGRTSDDLLLPELRNRINDVTEVRVTRNDGQYAIVKNDGSWVLPGRDNYAADVGKLREILVALSDATVVEQKTSNPDKYGVLDVDDPAGEDSGATLLTISGDSFEYGVVIGKTAQANYRYVRIVDAQQSVLINQNPDLPDTIAGWMDSDLLDIASSVIQSVSIRHADGERIDIAKAAQEDSNFVVSNVPEGREITYETVANGIGGALAGLIMEDVRKSPADIEPAVTTEFHTYDGLTLSITTFTEEDSSWVSIAAASTEENSVADAINERLSGWQFRIPDYKANLLRRRFDDILKPMESDFE